MSSIASIFYQSGLIDEALVVTVMALDEVPDVVALHFVIANLYASKVKQEDPSIVIIVRNVTSLIPQ